MPLIEKSLKALKTKLDEHGTIELIAEKGHLITTQCTFNSPLNDSDLHKFQEKSNVPLPSDYRNFLKLHNGAKFFEMLLGNENVGGGLNLFSLPEAEETTKNMQLQEFSPSIFLVGFVSDYYLAIDTDRTEKDDMNYLFIGTPPYKQFKPLDLSLELFLERYILAQGSYFWEWPIYTAKNYYKF